VQCWGWNAYGQLGNSSISFGGVARLPTRVVGLEDGVTAIAVQGGTPCAITDGGVQCWGGVSLYSDAGVGEATPVVGLPGNATTIAAGLWSGCAVVSGGAWCWEYPPVARQFEGLSSGVTDIAVGGCAVLDGGALCWGIYSQTANGVKESPTPVPGLARGVSAVSVSSYGTACALVSGEVQCWGENLEGQLGDGSDAGSLEPVRVVGLEGVSAISVGWWHACAIVGGAVWCWGDNSEGELGNLDAGEQSTVPVPVVGLPGTVSAIAAGTLHTCAIAEDQVWCWGRNLLGELGNPDAGIQSVVPVPVGPWAP